MGQTFLPVSVAARQGVSALVELCQGQRVALTSRGRVVAVIDSPATLTSRSVRIREAAAAVVEAAADLAAGRDRHYGLDELCARAGVEVQRVRERASRMRVQSDAR